MDLEKYLERSLSTVGATSSTLYVQDSLWPGELRLAAMPGVTCREPMYGFLAPSEAKNTVTRGDDESFVPDTSANGLSNGLVHHAALLGLVKREPLFGDFITRENVKSSARFINRDAKKVSSVLFVNFSHKRKRFSETAITSLRTINQNIVELLGNTYNWDCDGNEFSFRRFFQVYYSIDRNPGGSLDEALGKILDAALIASDLDKRSSVGTIHRYDPKLRRLDLVSRVGKSDRSVLQKYRKLSVDEGEGVVSWVALRKRPILIDDITNSVFHRRGIYIPNSSGMVSELALPILGRNEELLGVINLETNKSNVFKANTLRVLSYIACRAARAFEEFRDEQELMQILRDAPNRIGIPRPLDDLAIVAMAGLKASYCDIWAFDPELRQFQIAGVTANELAVELPPRKGGWSDYLTHTRYPVMLSDIRGATDFKVFEWRYDRRKWTPAPKVSRQPKTVHAVLLNLKVSSEIGIPIHFESECIGVAWLKYEKIEDVPTSIGEMSHVLLFIHRIALVLSSLRQQGQKQHMFKTEGMRLLLTSLQHDVIGRISSAIYVKLDQILKSAKTPVIGVEREDLERAVKFLDLQRSNVFYLKCLADESEGPIKPVKKNAYLHQIVSRAIEVADLAQEKPLCVNRISRNCVLETDEILLTLVISNLIQNSKKFTANRSTTNPIFISMKKKMKRISIVVDDCAGGFSKEILGKLYKEFGPQVTGDHPASGSGTGLYLCHRILHALGGRISMPVDNARQGTSISLSLPM